MPTPQRAQAQELTEWVAELQEHYRNPMDHAHTFTTPTDDKSRPVVGGKRLANRRW